MEYFDIVDEYGNKTGGIVERTLAHRTGVPHRTAHVWIFRYKDDVLQVLIQKRCLAKDSFPGCYDISSAGHVSAGQEYEESALRELKEELGVTIQPDQLINCGIHNFHTVNNFRGIPYDDNQASQVYILWLDMEADAFTLQESEIESVRWIGFEECIQAVKDHAFTNCMELSELAILKAKLQEMGTYR